MKLDALLAPGVIDELVSAVEARVIKRITDDPLERIVPMKARFTLGEVYELAGISEATVSRKQWLRIIPIDEGRPTRSEVIAYLRKSEGKLRAEYELRISRLGGKK